VETTIYQIKVFDVIYVDPDRWLVLADTQAVDVSDDKPAAVELARRMALASRPSRLVVRAIDGEIESVTPFEHDGC
jgi:hypothetical protein